MSALKTVLLVDDNRTSSHCLGTVLKRMGFGVVATDSSRGALKLFKQARPDILLIEAGMSSLSGPDTLMAMRKDPNLGMTPAVMLSSISSESLIRRCAEAGSNGFLTRPVKLDVLHGLLQEFTFRKAGFRRRHMRINAGIRVMMTMDGAVRHFITETVSEGGLFVRTDNPYPVVSEVAVSLPSAGRELKVKGLVIYHRGEPDDRKTGMAVEFVGLPDGDALSVKRLVAELMTRDLGGEPDGTARLSGGAAHTVIDMRWSAA